MATPGPWKDERPMPDRGYMETDQAWTGWLEFAGLMLILLGGMHAIQGLAALFKDDFFLVGEKGILAFNFTAWGWIFLVLGVVVLFAGIGILRGKTWARAVGVVVAGLSALGQLTFLDAHPVWSALIITFDVIAIYALIVHGREMATEE
jgi:hypothetical protein